MPALLLLSTSCIGPSARKRRGSQDDNSGMVHSISSKRGSPGPYLADDAPRVGAPSWKTARVVLPTPKEIVTMRGLARPFAQTYS